MRSRGFKTYILYLVAGLVVGVYLPSAILIHMAPLRWASVMVSTVLFQKDVLTGEAGTETLPPKADILLIGDSTTSASIQAKELGNAYSLATWGSSSIEISHFLAEYLRRYKAPKCIVLGSIYMTSQYFEVRFWDTTLKGNILSWPELMKLYSESESLDDFPASEYSFPQYLSLVASYKLRLTPLYVTELRRALTGSRFNRNRAYYENLKFHKGSLPFIPSSGGEGGFAIADLYGYLSGGSIKPHKILDEHYKKIGALAREAGAKLYVVHPPVALQLRTPSGMGYIKSIEQHYRKIYSDLDASQFIFEMPEYPEDHFVDGFHMNSRGSAAYSNYLKARLDCY